MSSTAADERPRARRGAMREALIEATAQIMLVERTTGGVNAQPFCLVKSA